MSTRWRIASLAALAIVVIAAAVLFSLRPRPDETLSAIAGAVLREDTDVRKQAPIANVRITVAGQPTTASVTDASGFFQLLLRPPIKIGQAFTVEFRHSDYQPLDVTSQASGRILVARLVPIRPQATVPASGPVTRIGDVRVRYAEKSINVLDVGNTVRTFEVENTGNRPCAGAPVCSPDGRWRATLGSLTLDAGEGNEFREVRVSCIAGPCPFTRVEGSELLRVGRNITVAVRNWSDTATFLVEAEVTRTMASDVIRLAYPAIFGRAMNFTLPATAQGPSIEADIAGTNIVFPLGPKLALSWAMCTAKIAPDHTRLYRCELKPGYEFR